MDVGDPVLDTNDDDPDLAIVVHCPDAPIAEWTVTVEGEERTVAADNPTYPADDPAVVVAFVESGLNSHWPEWTETDPAELHEGAQANDVTLYTFPASRLTVLDDEAVVARLEAGTVDMSALRARLADAEWQVDMDGSVLVAEKMCEQYRIHPTGDIDGEGEIRDPLENIVQQYTD
ncbi:hypothetical protein [Halosimplex pelagicum]|uniref:Uncharacterized protein n=1 Tax=Halosimplex pelagicum TaxID=869886 RepID=A0A7D5TH29_9EURY|nr:hypothetical protein [Halosimplex pelagicum]QLH82416.1 hypothetical protein HZS54_12660 [Halosimplex pelagicum]